MTREPGLFGTRHALVADDDPMVRMLVRQVVENLGLLVDEASDGLEAVEQFRNRQGRYDLVLLDLDMPKLDGFKACARLKELPGGKQTTVVVITGSEDHESILKAFDVGAMDFVTKPIRWPILTENLRFILRARDTLCELRESEHRLSDAQRIADLGSWEWNLQTGEVRCSRHANQILAKGSSQTPVTYADLLDSVHPWDRAKVSTAIGDAIQNGGTFSVEHRLSGPKGDLRIVHTQGKVSLEEDGSPGLIRAIAQDITTRKQTEARIHQLAYFDEMTGLPNREHFRERAGKLVAAAQRNGFKFAVVFLDIDRFRRINDSLGHAAGDAFLKAIADRLTSCARCTNCVGAAPAVEDDDIFLARLAGDEFLLLTGELTREEQVASLARRILDDLAQPLVAQETEIFVTGSMGIAVYPNGGDDVNTLMKHADTALEHAKHSGGNCFRLFSAEMSQRSRERINLEARLNRALENNEFELHYQAQVKLATGEITGLEALLRWRPKDGEPVGPGQFIPIAEETGLIVPIGRWVLDRVCSQMATWQSEGLELVPVAVNLSARQFEHQNLEQDICRPLTTTGISPRYLELELTERVVMSDAEETERKLTGLKDLGVRISIDDFGTGYSSLSYLKRFPLNALKIDRSFVVDLQQGSVDEGIVRTIIALAKSLSLTTIAEGVETDLQRALLSKLGCDSYQGYLFGRPAPASHIASLLRPQSAARACWGGA